MEQALKPCPFCGNRMELWPGADAVRHAEPIGKCPIAANAFTDIPAWNHRASAEAQGNVAMEPVAWMYEYDGRILDIVRGEDALAIRRQAFPYATFTALVPASSIASLSERLAEVERERDNLKASLTARAKSMLRVRHALAEVHDNIEDEGDRAYFGSTNDADTLKEVWQDLDAWNWDDIMADGELPDVYEASRKAHARADAAEKENAELRAELATRMGKE